MTKIAYVITKANWGGAQRYVFDLAVGAKERGHDVVVITGKPGVLTDKLAAEGIRAVTLGFSQHRTFIADLLTFGPLFSFLRVFRAERPDIVHVNSAKAGGLGSLAARLTRVPMIVFTAHGWEFNAPRSRLSRIGIRFFSWLTTLLSHKTIAVSDAIRRDAARWPFTRKRIAVIPNGITCPLSVPREQARKILSEDTSGYWIGMISELIPTKRVDDAIRAFALLSPAHPDVRLFIFGEGRERAHLSKLITEVKPEGHAMLLGFRSDAAELLPAFDLFVHASQSEALGLAILEAGCASLPVVATYVGGVPEIIPNDEYGILVPPRDPAAMADAITTLMNDSERAKSLGALLHERVRENFSKAHMLDATFALYQN